ncbi:hypothetical protein GCK32_020024 [Trichostrongylus colubriformis]|uniref:Amino acid permease/ SLC12A domain-containing protein n=1 Tax=Trichostrongylus colubriformis TaxID=6319 RepID=A0AAN8IME2_TRICO
MDTNNRAKRSYLSFYQRGLSFCFQAVCTDKIIPTLSYFAKGYGPGNDPRRAYALSFLITVTVVMIGNLNMIAPFISNFFLCAYALVNYACFIACLSQTPDVNWGTSTTATTYKHALNGVMKLTKDEPHVKNYRPQVGLLSVLRMRSRKGK